MNVVTHGQISDIFGGLERTPGVYQQGLMVYGPAGDLIYERTLSPIIIKTVADFCLDHATSVVAYSGETIFRQRKCAETDKIESIEQILPLDYTAGLDRLHEINRLVHKMILMADDERLSVLRPLLEKAISGIATLTQAVPGMLEVLPYGSSKGLGVLKLLEHIGMSPENAAADRKSVV